MPNPPPLITPALLLAAEPGIVAAYSNDIAPAMDAYARAYAVNTKLRIAHFLAQMGHESSFKVREEDGVYSAKRMREVFGCKGGMKQYNAATGDCRLGRLRDKLWTQESTYAGNAKNLLSYAYASRNGNGDEASGEGFAYRGRGMVQLTGKSNYALFTKAHNAKNPDDLQDFVRNPDLLSKQLKYGVESAFFFWDNNRLNALADRDDVKAVTIAVNGGENGLPDRMARLARVKKALGA